MSGNQIREAHLPDKSGGFLRSPCVYAYNMDRTTIGTVSSNTRNRVAKYRDENDHANYDEAINSLLDEVSA